MKFLLISINNCGMPFNVYPLGTSIVANILDHNGYNVKQLDLLVEKFSYKNLQFEIESFKPDIVGISIRNIYIDTIPMCKKIVNICHKNKISVFLGGSGFYHAHLKIMESTGADFGLLGPAESNLLDFVHDFQKNKLEKHTVIKPKQYHTIAGPLYEENILKYYSKTPLSIGINTKRGCRHNCFYCSYNDLEAHQIKYRDVNSVINDIKMLKYQYNISCFFFADGVFNDTFEYEKILYELKKEKLNISWSAFLRPDNISAKNLSLMKETGLYFPFLGIDGTTDTTLKSAKKGFVWSDVEKIDKLFLDYKIKDSYASFMFGCPLESKNTVIEGINNIKKLHFKLFDIFIYSSYLLYFNEQINTDEICDNVDRNWIENKLNEAFGHMGCIKNENI